MIFALDALSYRIRWLELACCVELIELENSDRYSPDGRSISDIHVGQLVPSCRARNRPHRSVPKTHSGNKKDSLAVLLTRRGNADEAAKRRHAPDAFPHLPFHQPSGVVQ